MKHIIPSVALILFGATLSHAQSIQWQHCYGGSNQDGASMAISATGGGFAILGWSYSNDGDHISPVYGFSDFWLVVTNDSGNLSWERPYGGSNSEYGNVLLKTSFGYAMGGYTSSLDDQVTGLHPSSSLLYPAPDYWLTCTDSSGILLWEKTYGGSAPEQLFSIVQARDGGFLLAGFTLSDDGDVTGYQSHGDAWIVKVKSDNGAIVWQKTIGGNNTDDARAIVQANEGGYTMAGCSNSDSTDSTVSVFDYWLVKLDDTGGVTWQKYYGGSGDDWVMSMVQTADSGYIMAGYSNSSDGDVTNAHGNYDYWVIKVDRTGVKQWAKTYGGSGDDEAYSIIQTYDRGYAVAGKSNSTDGDITAPNGGYDAWIVKLDDTGAIQWQKSVGEAYDDIAQSIIQTADSGYVVTGNKEAGMSNVPGYHSLNDCWIFKLDNRGLAVPDTRPDDAIKVYPTVSHGLIHADMPPGYEFAKIRVLSMEGKEVPVQATGGLHRTVQLQNAPCGNYLLQVTNEGKQQQFRITVQ